MKSVLMRFCAGGLTLLGAGLVAMGEYLPVRQESSERRAERVVRQPALKVVPASPEDN